jgi:TPR repeat protein
MSEHDELRDPFRLEERAWQSENELKLRQKAEQGDAQSQYQLSLLYLNGSITVKQDTDQAVAYLIKAAEQGHQQAIEKLTQLKDEHWKDRQPDQVEAEYSGIDEGSEQKANQPRDKWKWDRCERCLSGKMPMYCHVCNPPWRI